MYPQTEDGIGFRTAEPFEEFGPPSIRHTGCMNNSSYPRQELEVMKT